MNRILFLLDDTDTKPQAVSASCLANPRARLTGLISGSKGDLRRFVSQEIAIYINLNFSVGCD